MGNSPNQRQITPQTTEFESDNRKWDGRLKPETLQQISKKFSESAKLKVGSCDGHRVFPSNSESSLVQYIIPDENNSVNNVEHITKQTLETAEDE
jgi:predicted RNA-binding protein with PUA domain